MSQFDFFKTSFPASFDDTKKTNKDIYIKNIYAYALKAENHALSDPRGAGNSLRLSLEYLVDWLYNYDPALEKSVAYFKKRQEQEAREGKNWQPNLNFKLNQYGLKKLLGCSGPDFIINSPIYQSAEIVRLIGNKSSHNGEIPTQEDAIQGLTNLFGLCFWFARTYGIKQPDPYLQFNKDKLEKNIQIKASQYEDIKAENDRIQRQAAQERAKLTQEFEQKNAQEKKKLNQEIARYKAEIKAIREKNEAQPDTHDYNEAQTRRDYIDLLLQEAGWHNKDDGRHREYKLENVEGTPNGIGKADEVLFSKTGLPLAVIEVKRTSKDPEAGKMQAKFYADALYKKFGQYPIIFYTNGLEHWIWDRQLYPPRRISGFLTYDELELRIQQHKRKPLNGEGSVLIDTKIAGDSKHPYQEHAINEVDAHFQDKHRKALLVMATGSGKTRTAAALVDQLRRAGWVKRVLFLADRRALVKQASHAFSQHIKTAPQINLLNDKQIESLIGKELFFSTYPTMMNLIQSLTEEERHFGPGFFDLIIIDEAHRSIYQKYRALFDYFDSLLLGLTATPTKEIDHDTYAMFGLERGVPTDHYAYEDGVRDGVLVPYKVISVKTKFLTEGIFYKSLSDEEKEKWNDLELEDEEVEKKIDHISSAKINKVLFNTDTIKKVIETLMQDGIKVDDGDKLGKTIIFARNRKHAAKIVDVFNACYPHYKGNFAIQIDGSIQGAEQLIDNFSKTEENADSQDNPQIAVSVDMMDTGIDVPDIVNLVFFRPIYSHVKFLQMIGRGTRLRPDLFGPGDDKKEFYIFDCCANFERFNEKTDKIDPQHPPSLTENLFRYRIDIIDHLNQGGKISSATDTYKAAQSWLLAKLRGMTPENPFVRKHLALIHKFQKEENWAHISTQDKQALEHDLSNCPSSYEEENKDLKAKEFDLLFLKTEYALLTDNSGDQEILIGKIQKILDELDGKSNVPEIKKHMALITDMLDDQWWEHIPCDRVEHARIQLRSLAKFIEGKAVQVLYTNFKDEIIDKSEIDFDISQLSTVDKEKFKKKANAYLQAHRDDPTIIKIYQGEPITNDDLNRLEDIFLSLGVTNKVTLDFIKKKEKGLPAFIRSLIGLDSEKIKTAFAHFKKAHPELSHDQHKFLNEIMKTITQKGSIVTASLFDTTFTNNINGIDGLFKETEVNDIMTIIKSFTQQD